ncbi:GNAT family N-acetyltransferase [Streptomyces sp. NPDC085479]|uniref:GNAT family N-acetyltransferase n=1 Tax=Streptomyces sp. NPDC085479 TaxID=3365726 RepID=UPI0037D1CDE3
MRTCRTASSLCLPSTWTTRTLTWRARTTCWCAGSTEGQGPERAPRRTSASVWRSGPPVGRCAPSECASVLRPLRPLWPARSTFDSRCRASPPGRSTSPTGSTRPGGQGLATRAVNLVCRYAAAEGATQAVIQVDPENPASAAVAHRSGFTRVTRSPEVNGTRFDRYVRDICADRQRRLLP